MYINVPPFGLPIYAIFTWVLCYSCLAPISSPHVSSFFSWSVVLLSRLLCCLFHATVLGLLC